MFYLFNTEEMKNTKTIKSGTFPIWSTECPACKKGRVLLFEKGGSGKCGKCKRVFYTDYEDHPELGTPQTEYWLME